LPKNPVTLNRWRAGFFVLPVSKAIPLFEIDAGFYNFMDVPEASIPFRIWRMDKIGKGQ